MTTDATLTRSARAAGTRARVVCAARDVFVAQGYRASSLRDVAAAAGISHPGLLKHFPTKDLLLAEVVGEYERAGEEAFLEELETYAAGSLGYASVAARNERMPGYLPLFAALVGEGSTSGHPAHGRMRDRYAHLRALSADALRDAALHGLVDPARDPDGESVRVAAVWDGLQLMQLYLPDRVDLVALLEEQQELLSLPPGWRDASEPIAPPGAPAPEVPAAVPPMTRRSGDDGPGSGEGYRVGRERRAQIVADATALFARDGYADTSLREIAEQVGLSKSALLHHYPTKERLLRAVLEERDRLVSVQTGAASQRAAEFLCELPLAAAANAENTPGLIEVYAVLSCEALPENHPAHDYFAERFAWALDHFTAVLRAAQADGDLPDHRDPEREAARLVALWDGLQYQWLYERDAVDVASHLAAHLADILPPR